MIARGKSIAHTKNAISYASNKLYAKELDRHDVIGYNAKELSRDFLVYQRLNHRCEKNTLAIVLSPAIEDGDRLKDNELRHVTRKFLEEMKLSNHQWIAYLHLDRRHKHVHIYVNRIDATGKAFSDRYFSNRASHAAHKVARSCGLTLASQVAERKVERLKNERKLILRIAEQVIRLNRPEDEKQFMKAFNKIGKDREVRTEACYNKQGIFLGLRFYIQSTRGEENLKASEVDNKLKKKNLMAELANLASISKREKPTPIKEDKVKIIKQYIKRKPKL